MNTVKRIFLSRQIFVFFFNSTNSRIFMINPSVPGIMMSEPQILHNFVRQQHCGENLL